VGGTSTAIDRLHFMDDTQTNWLLAVGTVLVAVVMLIH
jgi:hypothetical protein